MHTIKHKLPTGCGQCEHFDHRIGRCKKDEDISYAGYNERPKNCPLTRKNKPQWLNENEYAKKHTGEMPKNHGWYCPKCERLSNLRTNYCHYCGKKLNGIDEE